MGSLGGRQADRQVLLDIGAGQGLFSLGAAARGHRVIALEASPRRHTPLGFLPISSRERHLPGAHQLSDLVCFVLQA